MVAITANCPAITSSVCPRSRRLSSASTWSGVRLRSSGGRREFAISSLSWRARSFASGPLTYSIQSHTDMSAPADSANSYYTSQNLTDIGSSTCLPRLTAAFPAGWHRISPSIGADHKFITNRIDLFCQLRRDVQRLGLLETTFCVPIHLPISAVIIRLCSLIAWTQRNPRKIASPPPSVFKVHATAFPLVSSTPIVSAPLSNVFVTKLAQFCKMLVTPAIEMRGNASVFSSIPGLPRNSDNTVHGRRFSS